VFIWFQELRYQIRAFLGMTKWSWPNVKIIITTEVYSISGPTGPNPSPNWPRGRPTSPTPWLADQVLSWFVPWLCGHVSTREEEGQDGGSRSTRLAGQVGGAPPQPYKYPFGGNQNTHTPLLRNSTCKTLILSVVAWCSLAGRVARLWGSEVLLAYREPSS
jgi:hypothetical protein